MDLVEEVRQTMCIGRSIGFLSLIATLDASMKTLPIF